MTVSYSRIEAIYKTLPIGYYLGRNIKMELSKTSNDSFYTPASDSITISAPCIINACEHIASEEINLEEIIRGLVYHEISHVILTGQNPLDLSSVQKAPTIFNIVEDERIETVLRNYYMRVNFRKNIMLINNYRGKAPVSVDEAFYQFIRYHVVEDKVWLDRLRSLIRKHRNLNSGSNRCDWDPYMDDILELYRDFCHKDPDPEENKKGNFMGGPFSDDAPSDGDKMTSVDMREMTPEQIADIFANATTEFEDLTSSKAKALVTKIRKKVFDFYEDPELKARITKIIEGARKKRGTLEGSIRGYSGRIDPKGFVRNDYKIFVKNTNGGSVNGNAKTHFNLFIDNSGSFLGNDDTMNKFIRVLNSLVSPKFDFDVITLNTHIVEWISTTEMLFASSGGNCIEDEIFPIFRKHQKLQHNNFNIVLFDGDAYSNDRRKSSYTRAKNNFSAFDSEGTIIISDAYNAKYIEHSIKKAKVKYIEENYCETFIDEVLTLLEKVM